MTVAGVSYQEFLAAKAQLAPASGLDVTADEVHPALKPHQRDAVAWAVRGGRRALFESFGLGKSVQQLEIERLVLSRLGGGRGLIVCPLGVRREFARDAHLIGVETTFIRSHGEASRDGIYVTNYESVRDGKLDPRRFDVVSLDEAAILRGFGGTKTFRELMGMYEGSAAFRFVATATPSPNEYIELLSYAAFLGILDVGQGKTRFFKRDSAHADRLTPHPHMEDEFWTWVASWALFLQRPSDLGRDDAGYDLPPLDIRWHEDIVDRLITRYSSEGETVLDPFGGLMTVPYCAVKLGRRGVGIELNPRYFADGAAYVKAAADEASAPTLFDLIEAETAAQGEAS